MSLELFIEFIIFDQKGEATIEKELDIGGLKVNNKVRIRRKNGRFQVFDGNELLTEFDDEIELNERNYYVYKDMDPTPV